MKKIIVILLVLASCAMPALAYDFQSGNLLYTIISTNPPRVGLAGHVNSIEAQGELVIPDSVYYEGAYYVVTRIDSGAFDGCKYLSGSLIIPSSVDTILESAFKMCRGFTGDLIIPNSVRYLGTAAFQFCSGFDGHLSLSESITIINRYTFSQCTGLIGTLIIPDSVTRIDAEAFYNCSGFTGDLVIPNCVTELSQGSPYVLTQMGAFQGCSGFDGSLVLPEGLKIIHGNTAGGCFTGCRNFKGNLILPTTLKDIGMASFMGCTGFEGELVIPDSVVAIHTQAFSLCRFDSLSLGESVNEIYKEAFADNPFQSIKIKTTNPPGMGERTFNNVDRDILISVPCGTLEAYQNADGWGEFTNMHEEVTGFLSVVSDNEYEGTVSVIKEATCEDHSVQVMAMPNESFEFCYWEANGELVSRENPYTFELIGDIELIAYFSQTGITELQISHFVYPNPFKEQLYFEFLPNVQPAHVELYDLQGRLVCTQSNAFEAIDMSQLPTGTYMLRVTLEDGKVFSDKVVKE